MKPPEARRRVPLPLLPPNGRLDDRLRDHYRRPPGGRASMTMVVSRQRTLADTTSLLSDASRATMLLALLDGRAYTASELARSANISAQTASFHLKRLVSANLLSGLSRGRYRYFKLAGPHVAELLERLPAVDTVVNPANPRSTCTPSLQDARACYNHLAGRAGVQLYLGL